MESDEKITKLDMANIQQMIQGALAMVCRLEEKQRSRELSLVRTKLDEARLWLTDMQLKELHLEELLPELKKGASSR